LSKLSPINSIAPARQGFSGNDEADLGYADPDRLYGVGASGLTDNNNGFEGAHPAATVSATASPEQPSLSRQTAPSEHAPAVLLDKTAATTTPIIQTQQSQPLTIGASTPFS
jgi:hypothetical protein